MNNDGGIDKEWMLVGVKEERDKGELRQGRREAQEESWRKRRI